MFEMLLFVSVVLIVISQALPEEKISKASPRPPGEGGAKRRVRERANCNCPPSSALLGTFSLREKGK